MSLYICSLNSGSNGNCYYIGNDREAILVDAGISCRETEKRMKRQGLDINKVRAIFISHEHYDHIAGLPVLAKKYQLPVFITRDTLRGVHVQVPDHLLVSFEASKAEEVGGLSVMAFKKSHDAYDPHSFMVSHEGIHVGVITDIGYNCAEVTACFRQCHAAFLESNYCELMLENGNYPLSLKKRIRSDLGHLSNDQALELFTRYRSPQLSHLVLSHLSKNNNSPELVDSLFKPVAGSTRVIVASRYRETEVFCIQKDGVEQPIMPIPDRPPRQGQLSLF